MGGAMRTAKWSGLPTPFSPSPVSPFVPSPPIPLPTPSPSPVSSPLPPPLPTRTSAVVVSSAPSNASSPPPPPPLSAVGRLLSRQGVGARPGWSGTDVREGEGEGGEESAREWEMGEVEEQRSRLPRLFEAEGPLVGEEVE